MGRNLNVGIAVIRRIFDDRDDDNPRRRRRGNRIGRLVVVGIFLVGLLFLLGLFLARMIWRSG